MLTDEQLRSIEHRAETVSFSPQTITDLRSLLATVREQGAALKEAREALEALTLAAFTVAGEVGDNRNNDPRYGMWVVNPVLTELRKRAYAARAALAGEEEGK